jgi:molecular chaperone Hsp33
MPQDQLQRFIFDQTDVRGEIVSLQQSYADVLAHGSYPDVVRTLMGEVLAATSLLSATMKFDGVFTLQARGEGDLTILMADCTRQHMLRGIAKLQPGANPTTRNLTELIGDGILTITTDPIRGERYQGIVPLESPRLSHCLEAYFQQSEQLPTRLWLFADGQRAGGMLLQALPAQLQSTEERDQYFQHLCILADTLHGDEFLSTPPNQLLTRLFHQENARVFEPTNLSFGCSCSRERTLQMLSQLGEAEAREILAEHGEIEVQCEFCFQQYRFDETAVSELFGSKNKTLH